MEPDWTNGEYSDFKTGNTYFEIGPHQKVHGKNANPERMLLNFHVTNVEKEFDRIKALGVKIIQRPYIPSEDQRLTIATFEDPDGNYFQIMTDWTNL
jgi:predicted enzyme related to lactoylglutathione lyase